MDTITCISWGYIENGAVEASRQGTYVAKQDDTVDVRNFLFDLELVYFGIKKTNRLSMLNNAVLGMNPNFRNKCADHLQKKVEILATLIPKEKMAPVEQIILNALRTA